MSTQHTPTIDELNTNWAAIPGRSRVIQGTAHGPHLWRGFPVATVHGRTAQERRERTRLIAAAPTLLRALETIMTAWFIEEQGEPMDEHSMTMTDAVDWARPIIREAKGELRK